MRTPGGALNRNALFAAQGALVGARGGVKLAPQIKAAAAKKLIALMKAHSITPAASLAKLADFSESSQETTMPSESTEERAAELAKRSAELTAKEAAFAEREQKITAAETAAAKKSIADFVAQCIADGRLLPRHRDGLVAFMESLDAATFVEFGEGDAAVKQPAREWLREFVSQLPPAIDYGEFAQGADSAAAALADFRAEPGRKVDPRAALRRKAALAYAAQHKVSFAEAATQVAQGV